jgi:hypothetical protein
VSIAKPTELEDRLARAVIHVANETNWTLEEWENDPNIKVALDVLGWSARQAKST